MAVPAPAPAAQPGKNAEDTRLANAFQTYLDEEFRLHPLFATQMGNHEFDDQLDDLSPAARAKDVTRAKNWLAMLPKEIDYKKLSRDGQIDYEIWTNSLKYGLWSVENDNRFEFDPRVRRVHLRQHVPPAHAIDPAARAERRERGKAHQEHPEDR